MSFELFFSAFKSFKKREEDSKLRSKMCIITRRMEKKNGKKEGERERKEANGRQLAQIEW